MARLGKTAQEFIQDSFSPIIAVLCSPKVENVVSKNNLSFTEMLQPFASMDWEGQFKDASGNTCSIKNWKLIIRDVNWKPLQPTEARRQLNNAVLHNYHDKIVSLEIDGRKFDIPQSTHWFDAWRETYLEVQFPSDHEFTKHFISCIIVGTTLDDNIIDTFNSLNQQYAMLQNVTPPKLPKWFNNSVLKSYLLLHDVSAVPKEKADAAFDTLKQTFGASNCFMLPINSKSTLDQNVPTDLWAQFVKRSSQGNNEMSTSLTNLPTSPAEPQPTFPITVTNIQDENSAALSAMNPDTSHPLTTTETDVYDNANSLQTHSFSGSSESMNVAGKGLDYSTEVHGTALNSNDIEGIKKFLQEYASKALLPYMEKQISQLSEVVANRKGVSRSLLSATKRWFGTGKAGSTTGNSAVIYTSDCPELQLRRLGDLWFLCRQWQRAFDAYHTAKREFYADSAWLCYAGALEMAAISAFMAGDSNRKTHGYMEESIVTYLNTCRMVQYAVRATLLSVLCLSGSGLHGEAAKQLIRMTSEDSDLRSAMLLEQAALCFLSGPASKGMCRKYAFHMVLAGHRFSKAGQKKHAYRCYKQAYQVYESSGWRLATDHVQFALGRLAAALRLPRDALRWLAAPLAPAGHQPPRQQDAFLREYMLAHQQWVESSAEPRQVLETLPLPLALVRETRVVCVGPAPLGAPGRRPATSLRLAPAADSEGPAAPATWRTLEEMLLQVAQGSVPMIFKPTVDLYTDSTDCEPLVPQGEPIQISVTLWNPLKISLVLKDVELLWRFVVTSDDTTIDPEEVLSNEQAVSAGQALESNVIVSQKIKSVLLEGDCKKVLIFTVTPLRVGRISIHGVAYKLINTGEGSTENGNNVVISGKVNLASDGKSLDKRLQITVIPEAPCLQMTFSETSPEIISGEMRTVDVEFTNVGPVDMNDLYIAVSHPDCVNLITGDEEDDFKVLYDEKYREPPTYSDERAARTGSWRAAAARHVRCVRGGLARGAAARARLQLRPRAPRAALQLLAYYTTGLRARPYRLLRHVFRFKVLEAVELAVTPRRSLRNVDGEVVENMSLAVEVKNIFNEKGEDLTVEVLEASLLSRQWRLTGLVAARGAADPLTSREKLHFVLRARRILSELPEEKVEYTCVKINEHHPDAVANINEPPYSKFVVDGQHSYIDAPDAALAQEMSGKRTGLIQSMFVLRWKVHEKTNGKTAVGQHCLWLDCFTKAISREKEYIPGEVPMPLDEYDSKLDVRDTNKNKKDNVVIFRLEHSNYINHNFNEMKLCLVPITLNLVNCYGIPVKVFIDMTKQKNRELSGELGWAGALSYGNDVEAKELGVSVNLDKFESKKVQVRGVCAAPGTYLVGSAFSVSTTGEDINLNVSNISNNTSLLVVEQVA
ncbi:trafficking protein particle complex subunit 8 [Spodoptera frugiperda]|uniref:Trafficking protein particle complex subunit 8 n=1 Tax=Spodoptera frugiperda TaxID=7108 RepID=A0A9R0DXN5_SPOFR|nr:trafficking protein particle complex subunit 8 [Spodoptera frugiperda]